MFIMMTPVLLPNMSNVLRSGSAPEKDLPGRRDRNSLHDRPDLVKVLSTAHVLYPDPPQWRSEDDGASLAKTLWSGDVSVWFLDFSFVCFNICTNKMRCLGKGTQAKHETPVLCHPYTHGLSSFCHLNHVMYETEHHR